MKELGFATRAIHTHLPDSDLGGVAIATPIHQTASFSFEDPEQLAAAIQRPQEGYAYSRLSNPTIALLEAAVADLEGAERGLAFASGMAAIHTTLIGLLAAGDHVVAQASLYGGTFQLFRHVLPRFGVETTFVDGTDRTAFFAALRPETKVIYAETIGNPTLSVPDLGALAEIAHRADARLLVDSTFATPRVCRPLELGADVVIHSASKYLGGHGDLVAGVIAGSKEVIEQIRPFATETGGVMAPFVAWLILRGLKTLALRVDRHCDNALQVARFLEAHPRVKRVHYPGLASHPDHDHAACTVSRFGGVLAFDVGSREAGERLTRRVRLIKRAASIGNVESLIIQPSNTTHRQLTAEELETAGITEGFIRLSVGLEDPDDLIADLDEALSEG